MNFNNLNTYNDSQNRAFEAFCNQLFERWLRRTYGKDVLYFTTVNGAGGDGGVEAFCELKDGSIVGLQAKWFRTSLDQSQIEQINKSISTAKAVRKNLTRYIVCLPRDFQSDKIGKGKKLINDTEEKRINAMLDDFALSNPELEIDIWNEHSIRTELQESGNEGIRRFWFDKEEISIELLRQRNELAKQAWLKERYIPHLHNQGKINDLIAEILYTPEFRAKWCTHLEDALAQIEITCRTIDDFFAVGDQKYFEDELKKLKVNFNEYFNQIHDFKRSLEQGQQNKVWAKIEEVDIWPVRQSLKDTLLPTRFMNIKPKLERHLEAAHKLNLPLTVPQLSEYFLPHNYIIMGRQGTGKTHGVAKAVDNRLAVGFPALIINAKDSPSNSLAAMLQQYLGGLNDWTDNEILTGLESLAKSCDVNRAVTCVPGAIANEPTKVLICIDGVEEAGDLDAWKNRVNEMRHWIKDYPNIRFVITARSYSPPNTNPSGLEFDENINRREELPLDGDFPVHELVPIYFKEYKLDYRHAPWIVDVFENALALRLFCEEHAKIDFMKERQPMQFSLTALLKTKVDKIANECYKNIFAWAKSDHVIDKVLFFIAESLRTRSFIKHDELSQIIANKSTGLVDRTQASRLLEAFTNHGILSRTTLPTEGPLVIKEYVYRVQFRSYMDYFVSVNATHEIAKQNLKSFPDSIKMLADWNPFRLTAISLLTDHGILVGTEGYWVEELEEHRLEQLQFEALSNSTSDQVKKHLPDLKAKFLKSISTRNVLLQYFLLPNLYRRDLNLAKEFIHEALVSFKDTFQRDLAWSGPEWGNNADNEFGVSDILSTWQIHDFHKHDELPLVVAWSFSSVDNVYREKARSKLAQWALKNTTEFTKLLDLIFFCGDPQIQEDLSIVMLGVASESNTPGTEFKNLVNWVNYNIFPDAKIQKINNSIVRHCARAVIERGFSLNDCDLPKLKKARPPYAFDDSLLPVDLLGKNGARGERFPIVGDLCWYVIEKSYQGFMSYRSDPNDHAEAEVLLERYHKAHGVEFQPKSFAISLAIAFIKNLGWNRSASGGHGMTDASHGSESKHATFEEKYTWLSVQEIQGYLADRVPFFVEDEKYDKVTDYNLLLFVPSPMPNISQHNYADVYTDKWYVPEDLAPRLINKQETLKNDIKKWVTDKKTPAFKNWLRVDDLKLNPSLKLNNKWTFLYFDSDFLEPNKVGVAQISSICCLIKKDQFKPFLKYFEENKKYVKSRFESIDRFEASPRGDTYTSAKDLVWMNWRQEDYSINYFETEDTDFEIIKTVTGTVENTMNDGEKYYKSPSKLVRDKLNIVSSNGILFKDKDGKVQALYKDIGKSYRDSQQFIAVNTTTFDEFLSRENLTAFWVVNRFNTTSLISRKDDLYTHHQNTRLWIVWEKDGFKSYLYHDGYFSNEEDKEDEE